MKKILISGLVVLSIFVIYLSLMDKKVYYLSLGSLNNYSNSVKNYFNKKDLLEDYVYAFSSSEKKITDIIKDINNNKRYKDYTMKNSLVKADLVTIYIKANDVFDKLNEEDVIYGDIYDYIDELCFDLDKLLSLIRKYCKEDIILIGYYNPFKNGEKSDVISYLNRKFKDVSLKYDISFVNVNSDDDKKTLDKIIEVIEKKIFDA